MLYIVRVYEDDTVYEYEYGNLPHAEEHLAFEKSSRVEIYEYNKGQEKTTRE